MVTQAMNGRFGATIWVSSMTAPGRKRQVDLKKSRRSARTPPQKTGSAPETAFGDSRFSCTLNVSTSQLPLENSGWQRNVDQ
jgi:hypothetical protein